MYIDVIKSSNFQTLKIKKFKEILFILQYFISFLFTSDLEILQVY